MVQIVEVQMVEVQMVVVRIFVVQMVVGLIKLVVHFDERHKMVPRSVRVSRDKWRGDWTLIVKC